METLNKTSLIEFVSPYYADKDIMHNMWHIELVLKAVEKFCPSVIMK